MASTTHISAICVPVALASKGDARAYLAGAGVMARLGTALGWKHYAAGWHATCTAGAPAAAAAAAIANGLDAERTAIAVALAVPAAGGVQRAFGTAAKALQVGFAADAGVRAAQLAGAGASADPAALDEWIALVKGDPTNIDTSGQAVPAGLAIKLYPCCYALQRPLSALTTLPRLRQNSDNDNIRRIRVTTPAASLTPLIHKNPTTGLQGKFSLEYGVAAALLDGHPGLDSFTDDAVQRPEARKLMESVEIDATDTGEGLLTGDVTVEITTDNGETLSATLGLPPGAPQRPPTDEELRQKIEACAGPNTDEVAALTYETAHAFLVERL